MRLLFGTGVLMLSAACDGGGPVPTEPTPPPTQPPNTPGARFFQLTVLDGGGQTGMAGLRLARPVVIEVRDENQLPAAGVPVVFMAIAGTAVADATQTDANGRISGVWTLGWEPGTQRLEVRVTNGVGIVTLSAVAEVNPGADVIIAAGAGGNPTQLVFATSAGIRTTRTLGSADSVLYMAPTTDLTQERIAAFASGRFPAVAVRPRATAGADTVYLELRSAFSVPITLWIADTSAAARSGVARDLESLNTLWRSYPWGLEVGDVRYRDLDAETITCSSVPTGEDGRVNVYYSANAQIQGFTGFSCSPRTIIMKAFGSAVLLAHEFGHSFDLWHPPEHVTSNFMHSLARETGVLIWQIFNAHFSSYSALNSVYGRRTDGERAACCLPPTW